MTVEVATLDDLDRVVQLWEALAEEQREFGSHLAVASNRELIRESLAQHLVDHKCLVARADTESTTDGTTIVGFVSFALEEDGLDRDVDRGVVQNLYVTPDYRAQGFGTALLRAAEDSLAAAGAERIVLEALAGNDEARRFYEARGYGSHRVTYERRPPDGKDTKEGG